MGSINSFNEKQIEIFAGKFLRQYKKIATHNEGVGDDYRPGIADQKVYYRSANATRNRHTRRS